MVYQGRKITTLLAAVTTVRQTILTHVLDTVDCSVNFCYEQLRKLT